MFGRSLLLKFKPTGLRFSSNGSSPAESLSSRFWKWTTQERPHWRESKLEAAVLFCVFGVTGSSSVALVRPALHNAGIQGTMMEGPNSYRVLSILIVSPIYATVLMTLGTLSGRHNYFAKMGMKILGRFFPGKVLSKAKCNPAQKKELPK